VGNIRAESCFQFHDNRVVAAIGKWLIHRESGARARCYSLLHICGHVPLLIIDIRATVQFEFEKSRIGKIPNRLDIQ
jgi:hypothetical protein